MSLDLIKRVRAAIDAMNATPAAVVEYQLPASPIMPYLNLTQRQMRSIIYALEDSIATQTRDINALYQECQYDPEDSRFRSASRKQALCDDHQNALGVLRWHMKQAGVDA